MCYFFFFNDTATTEIYTLSLHDALPICHRAAREPLVVARGFDLLDVHAHLALGGDGDQRDVVRVRQVEAQGRRRFEPGRSEEHTSELQSRQYLVCRLLLEKKN